MDEEGQADIEPAGIEHILNVLLCDLRGDHVDEVFQVFHELDGETVLPGSIEEVLTAQELGHALDLGGGREGGGREGGREGGRKGKDGEKEGGGGNEGERGNREGERGEQERQRARVREMTRCEEIYIVHTVYTQV